MAAEPKVPVERSPLRYAGRAVAALLAAGFIALLAYGLLTKATNTTIDDSLAKSKPVAAPSIDLPVLQRGSAASQIGARAFADGKISLRELRGAPVVLNFWASWCTPCREEAPRLERAWRSQSTRGALFVGLNMQDITDDARAFMRQYHTSYLNIRDRANDVAHRYGVTGLPETFFIDARGRVVGHVIGVVSGTQLRAGITSAETGRPAGARNGGDRRKTR
ncbi:MAG TPA: TlpA disulfide reductase family protein [Solirubrobacteraceae bacterium]|jgi:cytochrome c biogenesis protein CcmG/thiol:disulfide interchange protein DsbE